MKFVSLKAHILCESAGCRESLVLLKWLWMQKKSLMVILLCMQKHLLKKTTAVPISDLKITRFSVEGGTWRLVAAYIGIYSLLRSLSFLFFVLFPLQVELFVSSTTLIQTKLGNLLSVLDTINEIHFYGVQAFTMKHSYKSACFKMAAKHHHAEEPLTVDALLATSCS